MKILYIVYNTFIFILFLAEFIALHTNTQFDLIYPILQSFLSIDGCKIKLVVGISGNLE